MRAPRQNAAHRRAVRFLLAVSICAGTFLPSAPNAIAVEGGISFWVPGFISSFAAAPLEPGFSFANVGYHTTVNAGADVAFARQVPRGNLTVNFTGGLNIALNGDGNLYLAIPSYTFAERFLGGQANIAVAIPYGRSFGEVDATLRGNLGLGGPGFTLSGSLAESVLGFGDIAPMFNVRWNNGVNNVMAYVAGNLTVGRYDPTRLANLGLGHNSLDIGGAYTYLNPQTGNEFSATLGVTYNFENVHTQYQSGIDMHLDLGAAHFVSKQMFFGAVGYVYRQITCDSGAGNKVGCFESQVLGAGPQVGYNFPISTALQGSWNFKAYKEFAAEHRASGWNAWFTFAISPAETPKPAATRATLGK
jgi:hypothetical protein